MQSAEAPIQRAYLLAEPPSRRAAEPPSRRAAALPTGEVMSSGEFSAAPTTLVTVEQPRPTSAEYDESDRAELVALTKPEPQPEDEPQTEPEPEPIPIGEPEAPVGPTVPADDGSPSGS